MNMFQRALIGYDGSTSAKAALRFAVEMATDSDVELTALWVREPLPRHADLPGVAEAANEYFAERKQEVTELAKREDIEIGSETRARHAAKAVVTFAKEGGYDLIVIATATIQNFGDGFWATPPTVSPTTRSAACSL